MGGVSMDELDQQFLDEVCHMRLQIAYQRFLKTRTAESEDKERESDECDFYYLSGLKDGIRLQGIIKSIEET